MTQPNSLPEIINRPAPTYATGPILNPIAQRWMALRGNSDYYNPDLVDFLERDVTRLMTIARAAYALQSANNAEKYRAATQQLMAALA